MNKKATDIVAYFSIVGWLIAYLAGDKENCKFHLNQALVLAIAEIILSFLSRLSLGWFIAVILGIADIVLFVFWLIAFIGACKGEEKPAPVLGTIQILK